MRFSKILLLSFVMLSLISPVSIAGGFTDSQKSEMEDMFKDYIMNNPKVIIDSLNKFQIDQRDEAQKAAKEALEQEYDNIVNNKDHAVVGNPDGDITVVEFFDYNCGYCKKAFPEIQQLIEDDKEVRVIFIDFPVLGPSSMELAKYSVAANMQGKYFEFHAALMNHKGQKTKEAVLEIAKEVGLDVEKLKKDAESEKVEKILKDNREIAGKLSIRGTPGFIVGKEIIGGYIPLEDMKQVISDERAKKAE